MAEDPDLLPSNSTEFERAFSNATDLLDALSAPIVAVKDAKLVTVPDSFLPFLIYEYGLGSIMPYMANAREAIALGIPWQRIRGTPAALEEAMGWLDLACNLYEAPSRRRRWNLFHIGVGEVPELEDLEGIEALAGLSVPARSRFWRGWDGLDYLPLDWSYQAWSGSAYSQSSGTRLEDGKPLWSFARKHDIFAAFPIADLTALGAWIEGEEVGSTGWGMGTFASVPGEATSPWGEYSWLEYGSAWEADGTPPRGQLIAASVSAVGTPWACFRDALGDVIGYRRARASAGVVPDSSGIYEVDGRPLSPGEVPSSYYLEFMTDAGNADGKTATSVSVVFGGTPADTSKPGQLWIEPGGLVGGIEGTEFPVSIPFGPFIRERVRMNLFY